jgi:myo-inositol-1(or 4)-monophosphatase
MEFSDVLQVALDAARAAAAIHQRHVGRVGPEDWSMKGTADFVSFVDHEAETCIIERIRAAFPDHEIMAEESFQHDAQARAWQDVDWLWLVDPLDGTTNFLHGYPSYCASVGVAQRGQLVAGAVVAGATREEWCAARGEGATRNGQRISVSRIDTLAPALIGTGFPFRNLEKLPVYLKQFDVLTRRTSGVRRAGSAALDLCHVANGYFDGFWELALNPWDIAAGALIITEAGGVISSVETELDVFRGGSVVAGNPAIHGELLTLLHSVS